MVKRSSIKSSLLTLLATITCSACVGVETGGQSTLRNEDVEISDWERIDLLISKVVNDARSETQQETDLAAYQDLVVPPVETRGLPTDNPFVFRSQRLGTFFEALMKTPVVMSDWPEVCRSFMSGNRSPKEFVQQDELLGGFTNHPGDPSELSVMQFYRGKCADGVWVRIYFEDYTDNIPNTVNKILIELPQSSE